MAAALRESLPQPAFKFNQPFKVNTYISLLFVPTTFIVIIGFTISNLHPDTLAYEGIVAHETENKSFFSIVLPIPRSLRTSYLVTLDLEASFPGSFYSVDVEMFCQWFDMPSKRIHKRLLNITNGEYPLFSTSLPSYRSLLLLIQITHLTPNSFDSVRVLTIQTPIDFQSKVLSLRMIVSALSSLLALSYALALTLLATPPVRPQEVLTLSSLILSALTHFPFTNFFKSMPITLLDRVLSGSLPAFNLICLFCFLQKHNTVRFVLPVSGLFVMANGMLGITGDTTLLSRYFNDNSVVWVFFLSVTATATAGYAALLLWRLVWALCRPRSTQKHLFLAYAVATFVALGSEGVEALMFAVRGFCPVAVTFSVHYLVQALIAGLFADMHCPLLTSEVPDDQQQLRGAGASDGGRAIDDTGI
jgi:hypothetical protein